MGIFSRSSNYAGRSQTSLSPPSCRVRGRIQIVNCQDGKPRKRLDVTLIDDSFEVVTLAFWPDFCDRLNKLEGCAITFQNLQIREYQGKLMPLTTADTFITVDSADENVEHLNEWFRTDGCSHDYTELRIIEWCFSPPEVGRRQATHLNPSTIEWQQALTSGMRS